VSVISPELMSQQGSLTALRMKIDELEEEIQRLRHQIDALEMLPRSMGGGMRKSYADELYLALSGGTMTGTLVSLGIRPLTSGDYGIGNTSYRYTDVWANTLNTGGLTSYYTYCALLARNVSGGAIQIKTQFGGVQLVASGVDGEFRIQRGGNITMLDQKMMTIGTYTDAQRPVASTPGRVIFNTDDGMPNYDDGTDWRDINGNIT